jgi:hypothetical protein
LADFVLTFCRANRKRQKNARPFISMMYLNDTISVLSPDEAQSARRRFTAMQRSPSDPDYWLWDYERWFSKPFWIERPYFLGACVRLAFCHVLRN